jgi:hypothetical protein
MGIASLNHPCVRYVRRLCTIKVSPQGLDEQKFLVLFSKKNRLLAFSQPFMVAP